MTDGSGGYAAFSDRLGCRLDTITRTALVVLTVSGADFVGVDARAFGQTEPEHNAHSESLARLVPIVPAPSMEEPEAPVNPAANPADPRVAFAAGAVWLMVDLTVSPPGDPRWSGGILFDDPLRSGVTLHSRSARDDAALASDLTLAATFAPWLLLDVGPAAWREDGRTDAWNALLHMTSAVAVNDTATTAVKSIAGRQRPYGRKCRADPRYHGDCGASDENASFFSGHVSNAFTGAGMICSGPRSGADRVLCGTALATASATAVLRVLGDDHYATDVIVGGGVGWVVGYFWRRLSGSDTSQRRQWVSPQVAPGVLGLAYERRW